jgi:hypothetical protein
MEEESNRSQDPSHPPQATAEEYSRMDEEEETSSSHDPSHPPQDSLAEGDGEANKSWDRSRTQATSGVYPRVQGEREINM